MEGKFVYFTKRKKKMQEQLNKEIVSLEDLSALENLREIVFDKINAELTLEDPDMYDLVWSETKPKENAITSEHVSIGKVEIEIPLGDCTEEDARNLEMPKHTKYLRTVPYLAKGAEETVPVAIYQCALLKRMRLWLVPKPGYKGPVEAMPTQEEFVASNGFKVMLLQTDDEIKTEGRKLQHCVGRRDMGYLGRVRAGEIRLYSLHDAEGIPQLTIEQNVSTNKIGQISGRKNRSPGCGCGTNKVSKFDEIRALVEWLEATGYDTERQRHLASHL